MTLPETFDPSPQKIAGTEEPATPFPSVDPNLLRLRAALSDLFRIDGEEHRQDRRTGARVYVFKGRLDRRAIAAAGRPAYALLQERFAPLGFTPLLQRQGDEDAIVAVQGTLSQSRLRTRWWLHLLLLLATIITTTVMGAALTGLPPAETWRALRTGNMARLWTVLRDGLPFSLTLLTILGVHEMGHYVAARLHGVRVTLPFFIPLPVSGSLGTLGAVIFIRSPLLNRRALFDVGIAGPLAGLIVALPLYLIGLTVEPAVGLPRLWMEMGIRRIANPPLLELLAPLITSTSDLDQFVFYRHPMALAAWFGVLLTALNLLPLGQFDGGHVAYALLGRRAWPLALFTFFALLTLGVTGAWFGWIIWALMGLLTGLRHPPPHDDLTPLGWPRVALGLTTALLFALIFVPVPFYAP